MNYQSISITRKNQIKNLPLPLMAKPTTATTITCRRTTLTLTISAEYTGFVGTLDPKSIGIKHKKTLSHFRFYWHEVFTGENPTAVRIIPSLLKYNTTTFFGTLGVYDNALTVGPEVYSKVVGKAEGLFASTSQTQVDILQIFNFALTQGKYNGSTITFAGRMSQSEKVRELPIVGGSGVFKFATGYMETSSLSFDPQTRDNTFQFDVYIYY